MFPSYSPFFTSGLLSASNSEHRRGSLPVTVSPSSRYSIADDSSTFYFAESSSFLYLDLAESQSLRSAASLKRKASSRDPPPSSALPAIPQNTVLSTNFNATSRPVYNFTPIRRQNTTSTVSTGYRRTKRNDALARLEGRTRPIDSNFMSLSDDEEEPEDAVVDNKVTISTLLHAITEDENLVMPRETRPEPVAAPAPAASVHTNSSGSLKKRLRASSWLPLKSFIDLCDFDDDSSIMTTTTTQWPSFIEISSLS